MRRCGGSSIPRAIIGIATLATLLLGPGAATADAAPGFVQKVDAAGLQVPTSGLALTPASAVTAGNRLVVVTSAWSYQSSTVATVTDSAGNTYVKLRGFQASDGTEMSIWTAPVTAGGGTRPTVTVRPTSTAYSLGATVLEYSGLQTVADASVMDRIASASGTTGGSGGSVASGPTGLTTTGGIALGVYVDSGFGGAVTGASGWTVRENRSPAGDATMLVQDRLVGPGETPNSSAGTAANTTWLKATVVLKAAGGGPTAPTAPTAVSATGGNASATVSWTAPSNGGSAITSYEVTPYVNGSPGTTRIVSGSPPATTTTITGLQNGTTYTFRVRARNAVGLGPESTPSNGVTPSAAPAPAFVQKVDAAGLQVPTSGLALTPASAVTAGNRLVVVTGMWSGAGATAASVTDSAGNTYVKLRGFQASDGTEMSIWTAPVTAGGGTRPTVTVRPTSTAYSLGATVLEYSGLQTVADASVMDRIATASGRTGPAGGTVASGAVSPATTNNALALGFYVDSGFGGAVTGASGWTVRENRSPAGDMTMLAQDRVVDAGATPGSTAGTGPSTDWLKATVLLKSSGQSTPPTAPSAPTGVTATGGDQTATVSWQAPATGGSPITSYEVTPYIGSAPQPTRTVTGSPPATTTVINGLTNGTVYTFRVRARNSVGPGPDSAPSNPVTPAEPTGDPDGEWSALETMPTVSVHSMMLETGNTLHFGGWDAPNTPTYIRDATTGAFTTRIAPGSIFCSGMVQLPDGRILAVGGHGAATTGDSGIVNTTIFDPDTSTWTRVADMHTARWYPSVTPLGDGRYLALSGNSDNPSTWADTPEVYDAETNTWTELNGIDTSEIHVEEYPMTFLTPGGKVFAIGPEQDESFLLGVSPQSWVQTGGASGIVNGSSVMYRPGKVLYTGGAASFTGSSPAQPDASTIDLTDGAPDWTPVADMRHGRSYHTLTMLADGTVLAVGGATTGARPVFTGVLPAEIWDPRTGAWTEMAPIATARNYHSTALLRPDGRVLVSGGGHTRSGNEDGQFSSQIFTPPYLLRGTRPTIASAPSTIEHGATITVDTPDAQDIASVHLVSLGANTHQASMGQHFVPLDFTRQAGALTVQAPADAALAPAAPYMLFVVDTDGVPSVAKIVTVGPGESGDTAPGAPTSVTATAGDRSATVNWDAPSDGGSPITGYEVTPYIGSTAQTAQTVTGSPPQTNTTVSGLQNGTTYTFRVRAMNAVGTGPASTASNAVIPAAAPPPGAPAFVQKVDAARLDVSTSGLALTPNAPIATGNRLVVLTGMWSGSAARAASVTDSAGNTYTKLTSFAAADNTEMSVWTAPITAGGGTRPTVTVRPTSTAYSLGATVLEYSGLDPAPGASVMDRFITATGRTGGSGTTVGSGATHPATTGGLALGMYVDSGFGGVVGGAPGWTVRENRSPSAEMTMLVQDRIVATGATPASTATTGPSTDWLKGTFILKAQGAGAAAGPARAAAGAGEASAAPTRASPVALTAGNSLICPLKRAKRAKRRSAA